jgi:nitroimidazol reductase NimA-like FMN-containing flavoprotein (pyridoxamine 5'-phosphate oxidase superfamily)
MLGELDETRIDALLREEIVARLGVVDGRGRPYVFPIAYAYDGESFYGYTPSGVKLDAMRANPMVCVEVDRIVDPAHWESVLAWGVFEELRDDDACEGVWRLTERLRRSGPSSAARRPYVENAGLLGLPYRIRVVTKSGRFASVDAHEG